MQNSALIEMLAMRWMFLNAEAFQSVTATEEHKLLGRRDELEYIAKLLGAEEEFEAKRTELFSKWSLTLKGEV